ncbi:MAG: hypothetical protein COS09_01480 [Candidatus Nealsonbacteria bacterium CG01_land_8_20_14_3_00_12]|uniref:DUF86 domain-containing protein n=2 Tax=Candidatus Nealsoniibacteriota TaxID=1817911 RepID=A0A2M7EBE8_9BACT|nr:MAG: hypothetical protein COS09_01480 [Candidatus Nealsonbacteria bacterium CG01_land_8_20_14_3_00_12]PJA83889.1 MAG: hypothetical protein CO146_00335 [Candidatus Nealsonbacteria bacterium CG_4_9_14_3_um_filter_37_29]
MFMLDTAFIQRKIKLIQEDLAKLESLTSYSFDEIAKDFVKLGAVERYLEKIITRAIDINSHIIAELGKGDESVRGYEDTFHVLADLGVYGKDFAAKVAPSAGLRNRLVHEYNGTDLEIIYKSVSDAITQYTKYCDCVLRFREKN